MPDPIAIMANEQEEYLALCVTLEEIADSLPGNVDFTKAAAAALLLGAGFASHVYCQQDLLFPLLHERALPSDNIDVLLSQLKAEHAADMGLVVEVSEALHDLIGQRRADNPDMLGYLLRCFFESYRRHAAWEKHTLYNICRERLTAEDKINLTLRLASVARFSFTV